VKSGKERGSGENEVKVNSRWESLIIFIFISNLS